MTDYRISVDDREYQPVPESWLGHPDAYAQAGRPQCLAVSVALQGGRLLRIRYGHPDGNVVEVTTGVERVDSGLVPAGLVSGGGWPRTWVPGPESSVGTLRAAERDRLVELWSEHVDAVAPTAQEGEPIPDGGHSGTGTDQMLASPPVHILPSRGDVVVVGWGHIIAEGVTA